MLHQAVFSATGTGLVYVGTRYQAEKWASRLEGVHGGVEAYHAGLDADTRAQRLKAWASGNLRIIVCTSAFGMSIDKHVCDGCTMHPYPPTWNPYVQEAGRAGRDGRKANACTRFHPEQFDHRLQQLRRLNPTLLPINDTYQFIAKSRSSGHRCTFGQLHALRRFSFSGTVRLFRPSLQSEPATPPIVRMLWENQ